MCARPGGTVNEDGGRNNAPVTPVTPQLPTVQQQPTVQQPTVQTTPPATAPAATTPTIPAGGGPRQDGKE